MIAVLNFIIGALAFVFAIGIIVFIHELGHFFFAKRAGILCHEFALGMGPVLYSKKKGETAYSVRAIPIGGFVSMAGEDINTALIKDDQTIGLRFNNGVVDHIVLDTSLESEVEGRVVSFDLYGKDLKNLYIELHEGEESHVYSVKRDAFYVLSAKQSMQIAPHERSFESKSIPNRFLTIIAGPIMNFVLAFFLYFIVAMVIGTPIYSSSRIGDVLPTGASNNILMSGDVIEDIGGTKVQSWSDLSVALTSVAGQENVPVSIIRDETLMTVMITPRVMINSFGISSHLEHFSNQDGVILGSVYYKAAVETELKTGDLITTIQIWNRNNQSYELDQTLNAPTWADIITLAKTLENQYISYTYTRSGISYETSRYQPFEDKVLNTVGVSRIDAMLGVSPTTQLSLYGSIEAGFNGIIGTMKTVFGTLGLVFGSSQQVGLGDLSGPVGIFSLVSATAQHGVIALLAFTAFLSVNIGILNLLPIPALDGGRLVFLVYEGISGRPVNKRFENTIHTIMFIALMGLLLYVTFNDVLRFF